MSQRLVISHSYSNVARVNSLRDLQGYYNIYLGMYITRRIQILSHNALFYSAQISLRDIPTVFFFVAEAGHCCITERYGVSM